MNDHYFTAAPSSEHRYQSCFLEYRGEKLSFITDAGVFSRGEVDAGTRVLLNALPDPLSGRVLDLGCGWGAIGVSIGKRYPACDVVMTDVNERAAELARENAERNGVSAVAVQGDGLENVTGEFDLIVTNPPIRAGKQVIYQMFAQCAGRLRENGEMYLVIRRQQGAESAVRYLRTLHGSVDTVDKSGGYWVIRCGGGKQDAV